MSTFLSFDFEVVVRQFMEINRRKHCRSFIRFWLSQQKGLDNKYVWNWHSSHNCSHLIPKIALDIQLKEHWHQGQFFIVCCNCLSMQLKYLSYNSVNCLLFITAMLHKNNRYHRFFQSEVCWTTPSLGAGESKWLMLLLWGRPLLLFRRSQVLDSRMSRSLSSSSSASSPPSSSSPCSTGRGSWWCWPGCSGSRPWHLRRCYQLGLPNPSTMESLWRENVQ